MGRLSMEKYFLLEPNVALGDSGPLGQQHFTLEGSTSQCQAEQRQRVTYTCSVGATLRICKLLCRASIINLR